MGQVGGEVEVEHHIAQVVRQGHAHRGVVGEDHDALVLVGDAQLLLGADHALRAHAADHGRLEGEVAQLLGVAVNEARADLGEGHLLTSIADLNVGGAGDHGHGLLRPVVHDGDGQPVGVGVGPHLQDLAHKELVAVPFGPHPFDGRHLQAGQGHPLGQFLDGPGDVHVLLKPTDGYAHGFSPPQNCSKNRRSFEKK